MKCPKCQFENPDGIKFCGECGTKLENICPKCMSINPPQFKFCGECGHDLRKPKESPTIDFNLPQSCIKAVNIGTKLIHMIEENHRESDFFGLPFNLYATLYSVCGLNFAYLGNIAEGIDMAKKGVELARKLDHLPTIGFADCFLAAIFLEKGDGKNGIKHAETAVQHFTEGGAEFFLPIAYGGLGLGYFLLEEFQTAREYTQKALQMQKDTGQQLFVSHHYMDLGYEDMMLGDLMSAKSYAKKALDFAQKTSERLYEGSAWIIILIRLRNF